MKFKKLINEVFHGKTGSFIFYAVAVLSAAVLYCSKGAWGWIGDLYPLGERFLPLIFSLMAATSLYHLVFLFAQGKLKENKPVAAIHTVAVVVACACLGWAIAVMHSQLSAAKATLIVILPYIALLLGLPFVFLVLPSYKKVLRVVLSIALSAAVLLPTGLHAYNSGLFDVAPVYPFDFDAPAPQTPKDGYLMTLAEDKYGVFPDPNFPISTAEAQGVNSDRLVARLETIQKAKEPLDSVIILKNGYVICEKYYGNNSADTPHAQYSCTKSVISALTGIAIAEGKIKSTEQKIADFFSEADLKNSPEKKDITIQHMLTMTSGIAGDNKWNDWANEKDPALALFTLKQKNAPGTHYRYDSAATNLLSGILTKAVGKPTQDYAQEKLFAPLGITNYTWDVDGAGIACGGYGLSLCSRDMAKFGYLYLNEGRWKNRQLIPAQWVKDSAPWNGRPEAYGRLFWSNAYDASVYEARGAYGQYISVFPAQNAVVVVTSRGDYDNRKLLYDGLAKDLEGTKPLPENPDGAQKLKDFETR
ncbi:MAG: beta-lactamase family protein [Oscillospiraceae bacterium]|jgi:CubicO group peptidase (beta-lactamase class C family)|nr:beta-lactamase family protein [Oscillospiraceae bacterium]